MGPKEYFPSVLPISSVTPFFKPRDSC